MLYLVRMTVHLPPTLGDAETTDLVRREKELALQLQRDGRWVHIWRVVGRYENYSVFDVADHDELHRILWSLPLFRYMDIKVTPLAEHPSALSANPD